MKTSSNSITIFLALALAGLLGCEEQKQQALEFINMNQSDEADPSNLEKFGFDDKPTAIPTSKNVVIPFDNERTRQDARSQ